MRTEKKDSGEEAREERKDVDTIDGEAKGKRRRKDGEWKELRKRRKKKKDRVKRDNSWVNWKGRTAFPRVP